MFWTLMYLILTAPQIVTMIIKQMLILASYPLLVMTGLPIARFYLLTQGVAK